MSDDESLGEENYIRICSSPEVESLLEQPDRLQSVAESIRDNTQELEQVRKEIQTIMNSIETRETNTNQRLDAIDAKTEELKESVQRLIKLHAQKESSSFNLDNMKPYTEGDKRTVPVFIEEFEACTVDIEDEYQKGSYFRRLFQIDQYPESAAMPRDVSYDEMKDWFLKAAWNEKARKANVLKICEWTQESTGMEKITDFVRYLNIKLIECKVKPEDRCWIILDKVPSNIARFLDISHFETPDKLNEVLSWLERCMSKEFTLDDSTSESEENASETASEAAS